MFKKEDIYFIRCCIKFVDVIHPNNVITKVISCNVLLSKKDLLNFDVVKILEKDYKERHPKLSLCKVTDIYLINKL